MSKFLNYNYKNEQISKLQLQCDNALKMVILGLGIITQMHVCHDEYALVSLKFIR